MSVKDKEPAAADANPAGRPAAETRAERLAAVLRDNLRRRKAQSRARQGAAAKKPGPAGQD